MESSSCYICIILFYCSKSIEYSILTPYKDGAYCGLYESTLGKVKDARFEDEEIDEIAIKKYITGVRRELTWRVLQ